MFSWIVKAVTLVLRFKAAAIAGTPSTTKCSPTKMTLPGADAIGFHLKHHNNIYFDILFNR